MESFPGGQITPLGVQILKDGAEPQITYTSPDGELIFYLNGGLAPCMGVTEGVNLAEGMDGLHPSFSHIDHKGARQNGVTWADTVYDPAEMTMKVTCTAQTPENLKRVIRKWFAAWDPKNPGTLTWTTPGMGEWTCTPRLAKTPPEKLERAYATRKQQTFTWFIRNDAAFWTGPDSLSEFSIAFESAVDTFNRPADGTLGPNWHQTYEGVGAGVCTTNNGSAVWSPKDPDTFFTGTRNVVCGPFKDFSTSTDNQVITFIPDNTPEFTVGTGAANYLWGRMGRNPDGSWDGNGIRAAVGWGFTQIAVFNNFVSTVLIQQFSLVPPIAGEKWKLYCGSDTDPNFYKLVRDDFFIMCSAHDTDEIANVGPNYRGVGFGLQGGGAILTQATPAAVRQVYSNSTSLDTFNIVTTNGLGPNWPLYYTGSSTGFVRANNGKAIWVDTAPGRTVRNRWLGADEVQTVTLNDSPTSWTLTYKGTAASGTMQTTSSLGGNASASAVQSALEALPALAVGDVAVAGPDGGPYAVTFQGDLVNTPMAPMSGTSDGESYVTVARTTVGENQYTASDYQAVGVQLGTLFEFPFPDTAYVNIFTRLDDDDMSPTGVCLQIGPQWVTLLNVVNGNYTQLAWKPLLIAPLWNETWKLVCGTNRNIREFQVLRDGAQILSFTDKAGVTPLGLGQRGSGFGMSSGDGIFRQHIPPSVKVWRMGDNSGISHDGYLTLTNFGDQDVYPDYIVYGPGTFTFADGPAAEPTIEFGPLTDGQVAFIRTDPGLRGVYDISTDAAADTLMGYSEYAQKLLSLTVNNNIQPLLEWFKSEFGVTPQQGNLYSLLEGRFTQPIPAASAIGIPETHKIAVKVKGATASTRIVGVIKPQRRWPE